jgi:hypothetical protein
MDRPLRALLLTRSRQASRLRRRQKAPERKPPRVVEVRAQWLQQGMWPQILFPPEASASRGRFSTSPCPPTAHVSPSPHPLFSSLHTNGTTTSCVPPLCVHVSCVWCGPLGLCPLSNFVLHCPQPPLPPTHPLSTRTPNHTPIRHPQPHPPRDRWMCPSWSWGSTSGPRPVAWCGPHPVGCPWLAAPPPPRPLPAPPSCPPTPT